MAHLMTFEEWRDLLRNDCIAQDKLREFNCLGDLALRLLYADGIGPTVAAILRDARRREAP